MQKHAVVTQGEWIDARQALLAKEKAFTRLRDELSAERRALPWVAVTKSYTFDTSQGTVTLADLFEGRSQLVVYHFMYGPDWEEGCPSCSFWADNFDGIDIHLAHRDITLIAVSRAPLATLDRYKTRMGWSFNWVSSYATDFSYDFNVSFTPEQIADGSAAYNYRSGDVTMDELPGLSVFYRDEDGQIYQTYSAYARGLELINGAYQIMDLAPKGRDEDGLPYNMAWLRRRDQYED